MIPIPVNKAQEFLITFPIFLIEYAFYIKKQVVNFNLFFF